jgi:NADH-quinone oxidoreductase subunit J
MAVNEIIFYVLSICSLFCAAGVIFSKSPINSILFLILTFFCISAHYVTMNAQFLGVVNIVVYAGAIMVLFLFVVMLMNLNGETEPQKSKIVKVAATISGGLLLISTVAALTKGNIGLDTTKNIDGNTDIGLVHNLGKVLFHDYVLPFELSSVLFLSAIIGAIVIARKDEVGMTADQFQQTNKD